MTTFFGTFKQRASLLLKYLMSSYLEFHLHFWFLHLREEMDLKKVEKVAKKMTEGTEQLPLLWPGLFRLQTRWRGTNEVYSVMKAVGKLAVERCSCKRRTPQLQLAEDLFKAGYKRASSHRRWGIHYYRTLWGQKVSAGSKGD